MLVVTRPDKRRGRRAAPTPTPTKAAAVRLGLPVADAVEDVLASGAELGVVVAFGRLVRPHVLAAVPMVNVHFSLLPRWRGAAPVERAILAGDAKTGVCLMRVEEGLDTGGVYRRVEVAVDAGETAEHLTARLAGIGARMLVGALAEGLGEPVPQRGEPTYAPKIGAEDLRLDWERPAQELHRVVRLGRAWTTWRGRRLLVGAAEVVEGKAAGPPGTVDGVEVSAGLGSLRLLSVRPEGRPAMAAEQWRRGARLLPGERLGG